MEICSEKQMHWKSKLDAGIPLETTALLSPYAAGQESC
jgi:hypothetical protein